MLARRKKQPLGIKADTRSNPSHLRWVRGFVCAAWKSEECDGRIEAHHVRENGAGGTGLKPPDDQVVPLCSKHHAELHDKGGKTFQERHKVDLMAEAKKLAKVSPHIERIKT